MPTPSDDEYEIPLRDQRYFGAGLKRKRVQFVPSTTTQTTAQSLPTTPPQSASDKYLSIVLKKQQKPDEESPPDNTNTGEQDAEAAESITREASATNHEQIACDICHRPITIADSTTLHESTISHQICLQHSHPPSHVDRKRRGFALLSTQGWDPDSRKGLGAEGEGILQPIKAKENRNRAGLGTHWEKATVVYKPPTLDAGKARMMEAKGKRQAQRLRDAFYRSADVERYLGSMEGEVNGSLDLEAFNRARRR